jgi:hypothetical protein
MKTIKYLCGIIINWWAVEDELGMMTQLGMELKLKEQ